MGSTSVYNFPDLLNCGEIECPLGWPPYPKRRPFYRTEGLQFSLMDFHAIISSSGPKLGKMVNKDREWGGLGLSHSQVPDEGSKDT